MLNDPSTIPSGTHPYDALTPDVILDAVETVTSRCTGALLALNSYENRVYRVDLEDGTRVAAKFYRPERWSDAAIEEEHAFMRALVAVEIPAVAPLVKSGTSLQRHAGFRFAIFPWQPGRHLELSSATMRVQVGRYLGRLHRAGNAHPFRARETITVAGRGHSAVQYLLSHAFVPDYLQAAYRSVAETLLKDVETIFAAVGAYNVCNLHGDCHLSNILWTDTGPHFVDFDDCARGPAIQDLWMLLAGERDEMEAQLADVLQGYTEFMAFEPRELQLIEALRALRLLHYSAWLARRWQDPAFPRNFPWFNTQRYWEEQILILREQLAMLAEPPLRWIDDAAFNR